MENTRACGRSASRWRSLVAAQPAEADGNGLQYTFGSQDLGRLERHGASELGADCGRGSGADCRPWDSGHHPDHNRRLLVRYTSIGALIGMTAEAERDGDVSFRQGLRQGWKTLLHLFLIALVVGIAAFLATFVFIIIVIAAAALVALPAVPMFRAGMVTGTIAGVAWVALFGCLLMTITILAAIALGGAISLIRSMRFGPRCLRTHRCLTRSARASPWSRRT